MAEIWQCAHEWAYYRYTDEAWATVVRTFDNRAEAEWEFYNDIVNALLNLE
jgi:hypothetical protein